MEIQINGAQTTSGMKTTKQRKRSNSSSKKGNNVNSAATVSNTSLHAHNSEMIQEHNEILLLIDIKVNEYNQLSNIYTITIDQTERKILNFMNYEIEPQQKLTKLTEALHGINTIMQKHASNPSFFIVYPKKTISSVLFKIFRSHKIQVSDLGFTNTFISLGQLMPSQYVVDEIILYNQFLSFINLKTDEELAKMIEPIQNSMQNNLNQTQSGSVKSQQHQPQLQDKQVLRVFSQSVDLHGLQSALVKKPEVVSNLLIPTQAASNEGTKTNKDQEPKLNGIEIKDTETKQGFVASKEQHQYNEPIISSTSSMTPLFSETKQLQSMPPSLLSSSQNTPTQQQLFAERPSTSLSSSLLTTFLHQSDQQKEQPKTTRNISSLFDFSNNNNTSSILNNSSILQTNQISFSSNPSYAMQPEQTIFSSLATPSLQKRPTSLSLDSNNMLGGQSSLFSSILNNKQANQSSIINSNGGAAVKTSSIWSSNLNTSPLAPIQENHKRESSEMSLERNPQTQKQGFPLIQKDQDPVTNQGYVSSSSSICSQSTYASNKILNEQQLNSGLKFSPQLNFFILVVKLIKQGFQFKKECLINFKSNLTIDTKSKYGKQIQDMASDGTKKPTQPQVTITILQDDKKLSGDIKSVPPKIISEKFLQEYQAQDMIKNGFSMPQPSQQKLSRKQILFQQQWANSYLGGALPQSVDPKTRIQEELTRRSLEVQEKLSKNEENKNLDLLFVIDFECNQPGYEIIEFPVLVIDLKKQRIIDTFHTYVKPTISPKINPYISKITGIQQKDVTTAPSFVQVIQKVEAFLAKYKDYEGCILYDCHSDCNYLKTEFVNKNYVPKSDVFFTFINLRNVFPLEISGGVINRSLSHAQQVLQMEFQGSKHKGIDDARNQALVCIELVKRGYSFTQFMIQPQFLKQDPKFCVKNNMFNLYEYNTNFLLIKLDVLPTESQGEQFTQNQLNLNHRAHPAALQNLHKKYLKFTCFLTEKNDQINQVHRIKDSTFYFDLATAQASGAGVSSLPQSTHPRNMVYFQQPHDNSDTFSNKQVNSGQVQQYQQQHNQHKQSHHQKHDNGHHHIDEHIKHVEKTFYHQFSNYLKRHNIQRNKTAFVLLGMDRNEFSNFQKAYNLTQYEKDLFFNEKFIYIDESLVQFSGFLDIYKLKDHHHNPRKNSASVTPYKRKRSLSDDLLTSSMKLNVSHPVQFSDALGSNHNHPTPQRKNSLKVTNQSPMIKPTSNTVINDSFNLNSKDEYNIVHKGDLKNQTNEQEKNIQKTSRKRSGKDFINAYDPKGVSKSIEKQQQPQQIQQQQTQQVQIQQNMNNTNNLNYHLVQNFSLDNQQISNSINQPNSQTQILGLNNLTSNGQSNNNYTKEQICQFLLNDEFSLNFINFILVNRKKLQEYQDLAYHWQYINNKSQ